MGDFDNHSVAIAKYLLQQGKSKKEIADLAGYSSPRMIDYILQNGDRLMSNRAISRIADYLQISSNELIARAISMESQIAPPTMDNFYFVPKLKAKPRGGDGGHDIDNDYEGWYAFTCEFLERKGNKDAMRLYEVSGESMMPTLTEGDMILVDTSKRELFEGKIYLFSLDDSFLVKRFGVMPGKLILKSDNRNNGYPDIEISPEYQSFTVHGMLLWSCREY